MQHYVHSEGGFGHVNEDVAEVREYPSEYGVLLCGVADGMGGQAGGRTAAEVAVKASLDLAGKFGAAQLRKEATWIEILSGADAYVSEADLAGFTTLICLGIVGDVLVGASCGDSAALLLDGRGGLQILTEGQRKNPPVGSGGALPVSFSAPLERGWQVLVMSDGVWKYLSWEAIISLAQGKQGFDLILALRQLADERCQGKLWDDWTVAVLAD